MAYTFTEKDERLILGVFDELVHMDYRKLNTLLGSITIKDMQALYWRLYYNKYCEKHGIQYDDMTEEDFINAYMEE